MKCLVEIFGRVKSGCGMRKLSSQGALKLLMHITGFRLSYRSPTTDCSNPVLQEEQTRRMAFRSSCPEAILDSRSAGRSAHPLES